MPPSIPESFATPQRLAARMSIGGVSFVGFFAVNGGVSFVGFFAVNCFGICS
jgi:hypothetical protein